MKLTPIAVSLVLVTCLLDAGRAAHCNSARQSALGSLMAVPNYHATAVRADYGGGLVGGRIANTICHVTNTSASESIVLKEVVILGAGGVDSILAVDQGLVDQVVPPLATVDLSIDNNIPGVAQQTPTFAGVRQVVFLWTGTEGLVNLNASIETSLSFNIYTRAELVEHGFDVKP